MLSLHHDVNIGESTGDKREPEVITFYNGTKSRLDVTDETTASDDYLYHVEYI